MDQFEQDYRNERRKALRDSVKSGKTSLPVGILQHGANRIGEGVSDTVQGIGAFAKSLYNNPQAVAESGAEGLEALYNRVAQEDPMAAMQVAQMVASGGTGAAILRGGRIDPSAAGSGGGNIIRGFHSTRKDFDEIDPERGLPTGNFGQAAYFSESNDYPSRLNPNSRIIESNLDTTDFLQAGQRTPIAKERVLGTLSVLNSLKDATGKPFKVEYDADTNTALVEYNRRRRAGEEGPIKETKTFDFNNSSKLFDDIKSVTWGLRYESMSTDRTNFSDFMRAAGFTGVKGGSDDDFHIGVFDKKAIKSDKPEVVTPKTIFDNPNVQYVSTAEIADKAAQFNLPRYDVGKFGGRFESGNMGENPLKQLAFDKSKRQTLKENINDEGIKEPIEIEVALSNGDLSIGDGHHRLQAAIELGLSEVPVVIKTVTNPRSKAFEAVGPAKVDTSGLSAGKEYSFSEFNLKERFLTPKQTAQELREQGRSVFENLKTGEISDRRFPESYTPMREGYYKKFAQGGPVMRGIGTLNETARNMFSGPRGIGAYQQFASGGEAMGPPPTRGPDPQGIGAFQQFADGGPVYMQEGGDPFAEVDFDRLTAAVIQTESAGDPNAVSEDDAIGLMQVLPTTGAQPGYEHLGAQNVFDVAIDLGFPVDDSERTVEKARELLFQPEINVAFGTKYLRAMIAHSGGDIKRGLQKYNTGTGNYQAFVEGRKPLDQEAVRYPVLVANALTGGNLAMPEASPFTPTPVQRGEDLIMSMPVAQSDAMSPLAVENRREGTEFQGQDAYSAGENLSRQTRPDFGSQAQQDDFEAMTPQNIGMREKYSADNMAAELVGDSEEIKRPRLRPPEVEFGEDKGGVFRSLRPQYRPEEEPARRYPGTNTDIGKGLGIYI